MTTEKTALKLYKATALPIIDYNDLILRVLTKQQENKLENLKLGS